VNLRAPDSTAVRRPLRFGVIADVQYAAAPTTMNRHYAKSLDKLAGAAAFFNAQDDLDFIAILGDSIDHGWENYDAVLAAYGRFAAPKVFVLGNHDFAVEPARIAEVPSRFGLERPYYDLSMEGYRFIVVDGTEVSTFATLPNTPARTAAEAQLAAMAARGEPNAQSWNGGLSDAQYAWLEAALDAAQEAGEKVVVFGHFPIHPFSNHALWQAGRLTDLLAGHPAVVAYLCGHDHAGNYAEREGVHFVNFKGMVDTGTQAPHALVELHGDRIEIAGYGGETSRLLPLRS